MLFRSAGAGHDLHRCGSDAIQPMTSLATPTLEFFADLSVSVAKPIEVGQTIHGTRRLIPILGGTATGNGWTAKVLSGGADFQLIVNDQTAELDARYVLETDAGDMIYVQNHAVRTASAEVMARLIRGEPVSPESVYFRCTPRLDRKSTRLNSSHSQQSRMPSSA